MRRSATFAAILAAGAVLAAASPAAAMYHPTLGRWVQRDPVGYVNHMALYEYCHSTPPMLADPLGLSVPGKVSEDRFEVHDSTAAYRRLQMRNGSPGQTEASVDVAVTGTYDPALPCCCTFTITMFDFRVGSDIAGVGVGYEQRYGITTQRVDSHLFAVTKMHEGCHRSQSIAVWRKYIGQLTHYGTCCYTRGLWIFRRDYRQSSELCAKRAELLKTHLANQLTEYLRQVSNLFDARLKPFSSQDQTAGADSLAKAHADAMTMRDWDCADTLGWLW